LWRHQLLFETAIRVKSMYMMKMRLKTRKKYRNRKPRFLLHKSHLKDGLRVEITGRGDARASANIIYRM